MTRVTFCVTKTAVDCGQTDVIVHVMQSRAHTLSIKLSAAEIAKAHALASAGDESIARLFRRVINRDYEARFGDAPPPAVKLRPGPRRAT